MTISWTSLRPVGLDFIETAEQVYRVEKTLRANRALVWRAFADPAAGSTGFPGSKRPPTATRWNPLG